MDFASGISADGTTFIGKGVNPLGQTEAWIVTVPEPGTITLRRNEEAMKTRDDPQRGFTVLVKGKAKGK